MSGPRRAAAVAVAVLGSLAVVPAALAAPPGGPTPGGVAAAHGDFAVLPDFGSLQFTALPGGRCELRLDVTLAFSGSVTGSAVGTTTATVHAPCDQALQNPPGVFADRFTFEGEFDGDVAGAPAAGELTYGGVTHAGGAIDARMALDADTVRAALRADATAGVGGSYTGTTITSPR